MADNSTDDFPANSVMEECGSEAVLGILLSHALLGIFKGKANALLSCLAF